MLSLFGCGGDALDAVEDTGSSSIWVMNVNGSNQTRLTQKGGADYQPSWSPDGTQIAFASDRENGSSIISDDIYVMNADGSNQIRLTKSGGYDYQPGRLAEVKHYGPSWSPDGTQIVFASDRESDSYIKDIYVMNADGSNQIRLTESGGYEPSWSPDGTQIVFASDRIGVSNHGPSSKFESSTKADSTSSNQTSFPGANKVEPTQVEFRMPKILSQSSDDTKQLERRISDLERTVNELERTVGSSVWDPFSLQSDVENLKRDVEDLERELR